MKKIILKYYLHVQAFKKKKRGMKMVTNKKELLVNLVRKLMNKSTLEMWTHMDT